MRISAPTIQPIAKFDMPGVEGEVVGARAVAVAAAATVKT